MTAILLDIQGELNYLPSESLVRVSERLQIPPIRVFEVANFYSAFSLVPRGKHLITVCLGTACHVRGADGIIDQIKRTLAIAPGETTKDQEFTLETVNCVGCCALGPVMVVDGEYHGKMSASRVERVLKKTAAAEGAAND